MKTPSFKKLFQHLQRGQALSEYWPIIPVGVMVSLVASLAGQGTKDTYQTVYEALSGAGLPAVCEVANNDGPPTQAQAGDHTVENTASVYDPETNTTTLTFTVTSAAQPSISHWVLGIPKEVADQIIDQNEAWEWTDSDPTTGMAGIKFDTGYEVEGGDGGGGNGNGNGNGGSNNDADTGDEDTNDGSGDDADTGGGNNTGAVIGDKTLVMTSNGMYELTFKAPSARIAYTTSREITLLLTGGLEWGTVELAVKADQEVDYSEISAPVGVVEDSGSGGSSGTENGGSNGTQDNTADAPDTSNHSVDCGE